MTDGLDGVYGGSLALLTDLYQLTMLQGYYEQGREDLAVFEFFVRKLPENRAYLIAAGLEQVLAYLEKLRFHWVSIQKVSVE